MATKEKIKMPKLCERPLQQNPFTTHRDPKTGKWVVIKPKEEK